MSFWPCDCWPLTPGLSSGRWLFEDGNALTPGTVNDNRWRSLTRHCVDVAAVNERRMLYFVREIGLFPDKNSILIILSGILGFLRTFCSKCGHCGERRRKNGKCLLLFCKGCPGSRKATICTSSDAYTNENRKGEKIPAGMGISGRDFLLYVISVTRRSYSFWQRTDKPQP